uniref:NAD-dependent epimerase/dehydratase family protein n=1 Tax=Muribaculum intestinale TaxID=1796646 RepID=UPI002729EA90
MKILITGAAGFIGANLSKRLVEIEPEVDIVGIDSMNDYYDLGIKEYRLREIESALSRHP